MAPISYRADAVYLDPLSLDLYIVDGRSIQRWEGDPNNAAPFDWLSKILVSRKPVKPSVVRVFADYAALGPNADADERAAQEAADIIYNEGILAGGDTEGDVNGCAVNVRPVHGSALRSLADSYDERYLTFTLMANGQAVKTKNISSDKQFRLPDGYRATEFSIGLSGNIDVHAVEVAGGSETLKLV